jgi:hypothetical protein
MPAGRMRRPYPRCGIAATRYGMLRALGKTRPAPYPSLIGCVAARKRSAFAPLVRAVRNEQRACRPSSM